MQQRFGLLAVSLMIFSCVTLSALVVDPKGFSLSAWQPLLAALIALGGAGIVYRSAMAKIDFDREAVERQERGRRRGILLRIQFALQVLRHDALVLSSLDTDLSHFTAEEIKDHWRLRTENALDEAWQNLDLFPAETASALSDVRTNIFNFRNSAENCVQCMKIVDRNLREPALRKIATDTRRVAEAIVIPASKAHSRISIDLMNLS